MNEHIKPAGEASPPRESISEAHRNRIRLQLEQAASPSAYETYDSGVSAAEPDLRLFTVRRTGTGHLQSGKPCQDYCLTAAVNGCTVITDADGVSACEHSAIGARLACEAVIAAVKTVSGACPDEDTLVKRLSAVAFRERVVSVWVKNVMAEIGSDDSLTAADRLKELSKYGSTLMFAVFTANWIVVGNLGDGQVLLFNDRFGVKLRVHGPKESSVVRCLVNERCAREDFLAAAYPRSCFRGVLLSTDGMYESLDKSSHFYAYCMQIRQRFLKRRPIEPYQPFCYKEEGQPYKDFSRMRSEDDCSLALAFDTRKTAPECDAAADGVLLHADAALIRRWSVPCAVYYVKRENTYAEVTVCPEAEETRLPAALQTALLPEPRAAWRTGGLIFREYPEADGKTVEFLHCAGMLRKNRSVPESDRFITELYAKLCALRRELRELGLKLNDSAPFNVFYNGETLTVRREALCRITGDDEKPDAIEERFCHLIGLLRTAEGDVPLFDVGYVDRGPKLYRTAAPGEELAQTVRSQKTLYLKNVSASVWRLADGSDISPGELLRTDAEARFTLSDGDGRETETYLFVPKELL